MKPTQAQIEAAAKALRDKSIISWRHLAEIALTAAAEVGEQKPTLEQIARTAEVITKAKLDTIERCAQVAENCELNDIDRDSPGTAIAAAIRALKDKP